MYISKDETETRLGALKRENETLKEDSLAVQGVLEYLKSAPSHTAQALLEKLRTAPDTMTALELAKEEGLVRQMSDQSTVQAILRSSDSDMEFELMVRHPIAYPILDQSADRAVFDNALLGPKELLLSCHSSHVESLQWDLGLGISANISKSYDPASVSSTSRIDLRSVADGIAESKSTTSTCSSSKHTDRCYIPQLGLLKIAFWTAVQVSDEFAAAVISLYLEANHPIIGLLDIDLFIQDLVGCKLDFCSPFLVSALLAFASVSLTVACQENMPMNDLNSKRTRQKTPRPRRKATSSKRRPRSYGVSRKRRTLCKRWPD